MEGIVEFLGDVGREVEAEGSGPNFVGDLVGPGGLGGQRSGFSKLISGVMASANEDEVAHLVFMLGTSKILTVDIAVLVRAEDVGDVLPVLEEAIDELLGLLL